jgi:ankyrin repeat protein
MLKAGCDFDIAEEVGRTALMAAAAFGHLGIVTQLICRDSVAEMDCLVGISACPEGGRGKPLTITIYDK